MNLTDDHSLPRRQPFLFVADDTFLLKRHIMKLYPGTHATPINECTAILYQEQDEY